MPKFYPIFYIQLGEEGQTSFYIKDEVGDWRLFTHYEYFKIEKYMKQVNKFEIRIFDIQESEKEYFKEQAEVMFFSGTTLILKGRIQDIEYATAYECTARGYGIEAKLLDKEVFKSSDKRVEYTNVSARTIAKELLCVNMDEDEENPPSGYIISPDTTGLFEEDYGDVTIRFEYGNRLKALAALSESIIYEWWVKTSGDDYETDTFCIASYQGSQSSVKTYSIEGEDANCSRTSREKDISNMVNYVYILGYGDGINQVSTFAYSASIIYSTLASDITESSSTITLIDASEFPDSGTIRIAKEQVTYTGKTGNDLTGCTRGANNTTAKAHKKGVYTEKYYSDSSPQEGSTIAMYGKMEYTIVDKTLINEDTAELVASKYLLERMNPIVRLKVIPAEPLEDAGLLSIGDLVTITDAEADTNGDYRVVGIIYESNFGLLSLEIELSNRSLEFIEQVQKQREETESLSKYMQGATNIYVLNEVTDGDSNNYINLRLFLPSEAVAVNRVLLNFKMKPIKRFRAIADSDSDDYSYNNIPNNWTDLGGEITVDVLAGEKVLIMNKANITINNNTGDVVNIRVLRNLTEVTDMRIYAWFGLTSTYLDIYDHTLSSIMVDEPGTGSFTYKVQGYSMYQTANATNGRISAIVFATQFIDGTLTDPSVDIYVGPDDGELTFKGTYTSDQSNLDISDLVRNVGTNAWVQIQFRPNQEMKVEANVYVQIFLESK